MIGYLKGTKIKITPTGILLDVNGVGYDVKISLYTYEVLQKFGLDKEISMYIETVVREDSITLYGFSNIDEKRLFKLLTSVSGVGPKLAISILSGISPAILESSLSTGNVGVLSGIRGVGKKTAERLVVELKNKITKNGITQNTSSVDFSAGDDGVISDAVSALTALGVDSNTAVKSVDAACKRLKEGATVEELVREALKK